MSNLNIIFVSMKKTTYDEKSWCATNILNRYFIFYAIGLAINCTIIFLPN